MTRVTLENENGLYMIETKEDNFLVGDMFDYYLIPLLLAATYQQENIDQYLMEKGADLYEEIECNCEECVRDDN